MHHRATRLAQCLQVAPSRGVAINFHHTQSRFARLVTFEAIERAQLAWALCRLALLLKVKSQFVPVDHGRARLINSWQAVPDPIANGLLVLAKHARGLFYCVGPIDPDPARVGAHLAGPLRLHRRPAAGQIPP